MNITNDKVTEYIDKLYRPLNEQLRELRQSAEENRVPIILRDTETLILNLIRLQRPANILEIGTAVGYSASCFALAYEGCHVTSIELNEEVRREAEDNIKKFGLEARIDVLQGDAREVLEDLHQANDSSAAKYDMVFIDAAKSHYKSYWDGAVKLMKIPGVIISDNVLLKAGTVSDEYDPSGRFKTNIRRMREYLEYINSLDYADTSVIPVGDGLAVSFLKG